MIALICIIPNAIAAAFVLGIMGWVGIPLDIMTITIASISVGIGVDNTIHYMHRFKREFPALEITATPCTFAITASVERCTSRP